MNFEILSQNIKTYRKKANLTQKQLGERILKSEVLIRKYESGKVNIPPSTLADICAALNVTSATLLGSDYKDYYLHYFGETVERSKETTEKAISIAEQYKEYGDSWRNAVFRIENHSKFLLNSILNFLENTEGYYSSFLVDLRLNDTKEKEIDSLQYLTSEQVETIVLKVVDLVKYELYKLENQGNNKI